MSDRLAHEEISIESFLQMPVHDGPVAPIVLTTHPCSRKALDAAARGIETAGVVTEAPRVWPIEESGARRPWSQR